MRANGSWSQLTVADAAAIVLNADGKKPAFLCRRHFYASASIFMKQILLQAESLSKSVSNGGTLQHILKNIVRISIIINHHTSL